MLKLPRWSALLGLALFVSGCADQRPVPPLDLARTPDVAAAYRTTIETSAAGKASTEWRFWRAADRIARENPVAQTGDSWVRDGRTLFHTRLYHADRRGIEYHSDDLKILGEAPDWTALSTLLDSHLLEALAEQSVGWRDGYPYRRYNGDVDKVHWDITVRTDRMLPVRIERRAPDGGKEMVELLHAYDAGNSPWQPPATDDYVMIDYADLGDYERDPFVMRLQAAESGGHLHGHAH